MEGPFPVQAPAGGAPERTHRTGLITLLFTDMVGSTALKEKLRDRAAAELFQVHHALLRDTLHQFPGGEEIETAGDSFLLTFSTPSHAVLFALVLQARLRNLSKLRNASVADRIGIHLGEVVVGLESPDGSAQEIFGIQVDTCSRVMSLAGPGQVLLTRAVFDSARQSLKGEDINEVGPLEWLNHGSYLLKGMEEPVEICEVKEQGTGNTAPPTDSEKAHRQVRPGDEPVMGWRPAVGQLVANTRWNSSTNFLILSR